MIKWIKGFMAGFSVTYMTIVTFALGMVLYTIGSTGKAIEKKSERYYGYYHRD